MPDKMVEKVARVLAQAAGGDPSAPRAVRLFSSDARAALVCCRYGELVEALIAVRTWFQWNDAFVRDMADAECEPCNPREVIRAVLAKVEASDAPKS